MDNILEQYAELLSRICKGNPGCVGFIMQALSELNSDKDADRLSCGLLRMKHFDITGEKLYMLWNDCCDRNCKKTADIMVKDSVDNILYHINYSGGRGIPYED